MKFADRLDPDDIRRDMLQEYLQTLEDLCDRYDFPTLGPACELIVADRGPGLISLQCGVTPDGEMWECLFRAPLQAFLDEPPDGLDARNHFRAITDAARLRAPRSQFPRKFG